MRIRLDNGTSIEGEQDQITHILKLMGYGTKRIEELFESAYYNSSSRGPLLIVEMTTTHLRNAITKFYVEWVKALNTIRDPKVYVRTLLAGPDDTTWRAMMVEYSKRDPE